MKRNVHFSIFILLKCAFYQLPWKHCVTHFLDSLTPPEFRLLSAGELITTWIQVLERQLPGKVEASLPRGTGGFRFIGCAYLSYQVSSRPRPGRCHFVRSCSTPGGFCVHPPCLHKAETYSSSCKPEGVVLQIPSNTCRRKQHRWLSLPSRASRAPELCCNSVVVTG